MILRTILPLLILGFYAIPLKLPAQTPKEVLRRMNTIDVVNRQFYYELPFEYRNDHIIIKVKVGDEIYDYVLDTGGYNDITDEMQKKNGFPVLTQQTVGGTNRLKAKVNVVKVDSLSIGDLVFRNIAALQMNFKDLPSMCGINGALIGASLIKNLTWRIDYGRKILTVTDDFTKLPALPNTVRIPVTFNERLMPFIEGELDGKNEKYMFDLGSSSMISLTEKTGLNYARGKETIDIIGAAVEGGNGTLNIPITVFQAYGFEIGNTPIYTNKPVMYTKVSNVNLIGNPIIRDYVVTLNFKENELYLTPLANNKAPDGWNSYGFTMEYKGGKVVIVSVFSGLSAQKAGLQAGDEILAIDEQPFACSNYCDCKLQIDKSVQTGSDLSISIKNDAGTRRVLLKKEKVY